ncbi:MAG: cytochrome c [Terracidiphilus sp.]|jgi:mono/diheme cytochrome c family protein
MLKPVLVFFAAILFAFTSTPTSGGLAQEAAPTPAPAPAPSGIKNPVRPTAESQAKAKKLYAVDCAMCHGDNGNGKTDLANDMQLKLSDWTDPKSLAGKSDQDLFDAIRKGKDKMPPEAEGRAKNDEVWNLVLYIRAMAKGEASPAPAPAPAPTN